MPSDDYETRGAWVTFSVFLNGAEAHVVVGLGGAISCRPLVNEAGEQTNEFVVALNLPTDVRLHCETFVEIPEE